MKHLNYEPDVTGPLEGERLAVILGLAKPHKYQIEEFASPYRDGVKLCVFEFPKNRYAAAFYAPDKLVQEAPLSHQTILDIKAKAFVASDIIWPTIRVNENPYDRDAARDHENGDCDPYDCRIGYHECCDCGGEFLGPLNDHACTRYCSEHDRTLNVDDACDGCAHDNGTCDPYYCLEGPHRCEHCGQEISDDYLADHIRNRHAQTDR